MYLLDETLAQKVVAEDVLPTTYNYIHNIIYLHYLVLFCMSIKPVTIINNIIIITKISLTIYLNQTVQCLKSVCGLSRRNQSLQ